MNVTETAQLLAVISAYDRREFTPATVQAWAMALDDVPLDQAQHEVVNYFKVNVGRGYEALMPAHVRNAVIDAQIQLIINAWGEEFERVKGQGLPEDVARNAAAAAAQAARERYPLGASVKDQDTQRRHERVLGEIFGEGTVARRADYP